ncbi:FtsX-like permease family protein [uncultured Microscilla sp.]|uniref:ABC transporter permease n=1 Tax=uncultured Microscilla sp. TaxID=432653 RepID=UPI00262B3AF3|nr:FtsX-like permease family protein [uncultured Microscilla sp.]
MFNLLSYALHSLLRRWRKQVALVAIYALVVAFYASVVFFTTSLKYETRAVLKNVPELWVQKLAGGRLVPMPKAFVDSLQDIRGVQAVIPRVWGYNYDSPTGAVFTVVGSDSLVQGLSMVQTSHQGKLQAGMALCGTGFLELRKLKVGDRLTVYDDTGEAKSFEIVGAFTAASDLLTRDLIVLPTKAAQEILGLQPNEVTDVSLSISNSNEIENIGRKLDLRFSGIRVVTKDQLGATYEALFSWRGGIFIYGTILAIFAFLILAWERASGLSAEDRKELGVLKAVGWQISDVLWMKFWEGVIISLSATLSGMIIAYVHVFVFQAPLLKPFLIGWSELYPSYDLFPVFDLSSFLAICSLSVIPYLTATLVPAWRGAITDPAEVMQD